MPWWNLGVRTRIRGPENGDFTKYRYKVLAPGATGHGSGIHQPSASTLSVPWFLLRICRNSAQFPHSHVTEEDAMTRMLAMYPKVAYGVWAYSAFSLRLTYLYTPSPPAVLRYFCSPTTCQRRTHGRVGDIELFSSLALSVIFPHHSSPGWYMHCITSTQTHSLKTSFLSKSYVSPQLLVLVAWRPPKMIDVDAGSRTSRILPA